MLLLFYPGANKPERLGSKRNKKHHQTQCDDRWQIDHYTATAGALILKNDKDEPVALIGYIAYTKDGENDASKRPVTFAYNEGPGTSSYWLHMGILGPKKVVVNDPCTTL